MDENRLWAAAGILVLFGLTVWVKIWIRNGGVTRLLSKKR
jgi:hypothetical protein